MNTPKDIVGLMEAYTAVYDDELRDELDYEKEMMEEDLSFLDDLSDNELTQVMEEILAEGEYTLDECLDIFEGEILSEATVTTAAGRQRRMASSGARVTTSAGRRAEKTAARQKQVRMGRMAQATQRAAEYPGKKAREIGGRAKTLGGGVVSAVAGGAADIKRGAQRKAQAAGEKIQRAKEKVKGFLGRVGRAAKAGVSAARKEFSGQAEREARARSTGREMRRAARRQATAASARNTTEFEKKPSQPSQRPALPAAKESPRMAAAKQRLAKASAGTSSRGMRFAGPSGQVASQRARTGVQSALEKFRKKAGITQEEFDFVLETILEDLVQEGYAYDINEAFELLEDLTETEFDTLVESYLEDEVETLDFYDDVMDYLVSEGYAETEEDATAIMANMSEEWRDEILSESEEAEGRMSKEEKKRRRENLRDRWTVQDIVTKYNKGRQPSRRADPRDYLPKNEEYKNEILEDIRSEVEAMTPEERDKWSRNMRDWASELEQQTKQMLNKGRVGKEPQRQRTTKLGRVQIR